ncbi:MAG: hypothetical protein H7338_04045 [Candidatus Sericytochromatia bacterium]|nr:hypothetical protein [Candidatus Sericytochromatia bacterium]
MRGAGIFGDIAVGLSSVTSDQVACGDARMIQAGDAAYGELVATVTAVNPQAGQDEVTIRFAWAAIHGTAMLLIDGPLAATGGRAEDV